MTKYEITFKNENNETKTISYACKYRRLALVKATFEMHYEARYNKKVKAVYIKEL